jgi:mannose-6-phosphate isomerase-like protein (cupin superfamily)
MFADLPGGACQEQHWGYIVKGSVTLHYTDGTSEMLSAGQAYYIRPGHNAHVDEDVELVEFTRADQTPGINNL